MLKLSDKIQHTAQLSVMDELCNQSISIKEDMEQLETELKTSMREQMNKIQKDFHQEMQKFYTALMDDRIAQLAKQLDQMRDYLSQTVRNLHHRSLQSEITTMKTFRELCEAKSPDSAMLWKRDLCKGDPTYQFRGRWRQHSDRLNTIAEYIMKSNMVIPITGNKIADDLRTTAELLVEVMQQMFYQADILQRDDLLDMEDFAIFQETVSRHIQLQTISGNQVCNFIRQLIYHNQCGIEKTLDFLDYKKQLEVFLGILLQTTMKTWEKPGNCKCDYLGKVDCKHCFKYSILHQHFPDHNEAHIEKLMELLDSINTQTCDCSNHANLPMHGPSKYIKEPTPTYNQMQQLHLEMDSTLQSSDLQELYVNTIISWIYARLYQYITPYTDPTMNKKVGNKKPIDWEFHHTERSYLENKLSLMEDEVNYHTRLMKLEHLADLKKAYCACEVHQTDRAINLLYQLKLPNTSENRKLIHKILKEQPQGFSAIISSCQQIIGTANVCELILYEVTSLNDGTYEAVHQVSRKQPHTTVKDIFFDFVDSSFACVCSNKGEQYSIHNLFSEVKGLPMVENATDGVESFLIEEDIAGDSEDSYQTPTESKASNTDIPELVPDHSNSFLDELD